MKILEQNKDWAILLKVEAKYEHLYNTFEHHDDWVNFINDKMGEIKLKNISIQRLVDALENYYEGIGSKEKLTEQLRMLADKLENV
tara:strand:- start:422 stop:679 length:258 start_codon:yes stop_codon:yes gene_type:complete